MRKLKKRYVFITIVLASLVSLCIVRWHAWFGMPPEPQWDGPTRDYVFPQITDVCDKMTPEQDVTILVLGDIHSNLKLEDYNKIAGRVQHIDAVAQTGDWMERGQNYYYQSLIQEWLPSGLFGLPAIVCPGNHEYDKALFKTRSEFWDHAFPHPDNGPAGVPGASFFVDMPSVRFIIIDTTPLWRLMHFTRTLTWLRKSMQDAGDRYVVVLMHHPVISAAKGRFNPMVYTFLHHALCDADLVLAGHDHSYMRQTPFVILNTAGDLKPQRSLHHADASDTARVYGVITVKQAPVSDLRFTVHHLSDGVVIDSLHVNHD